MNTSDKCSSFRLVLYSLLAISLHTNCSTSSPDLVSHSPHKINLTTGNWYALSNAEEGLAQMSDGDLTQPIPNGKGKIIEFYESYYPLKKGESLHIDSIKLFSLGESGDVPLRISCIDENWNRTEIAQFVGSTKRGWIGPHPQNPQKFSFDPPPGKIRYLVLTRGNVSPAEIEFFGQYQSLEQPAAEPIKSSTIYLNDLLGVNAYEWNFLQESNHAQIDAARLGNMRYFSGIRHYLDWERLEDKKGSYTFNPAHNGSWNYDLLYEKLLGLKMNLLVCLKTIPKWLQETYPMDQRNNENAPLAFGMDATHPKSYVDQAKVAFQFAARYGKNKLIADSLLKVNPLPRWPSDSPNVTKKGLGLVRFMECENERDKWWKGRQAYQTGREYAANLSAFYDGHMGQLGKDVGVKQADSSMVVVMGGLATPSIDYIRGMIDWCKEFRGTKPSGEVNLCWDIINFHLYTADERKNRGIAPELDMGGGSAEKIARAFVALSQNTLNNMPVWVTETGYDVHPGSPNKAVALGQTSILETQANWLLRTGLLYARQGVQKVFYYQMYDDNPSAGQKYATTGLMEGETTTRPAAAYLGQVKNYFGGYAFKSSNSQTHIVDQYQNNQKQNLWIVYYPSEKGQSGNVELTVGASKMAYVYRPTPKGLEMKKEQIPVVNGKCILSVTETPLFVTTHPVMPAPIW